MNIAGRSVPHERDPWRLDLQIVEVAEVAVEEHAHSLGPRCDLRLRRTESDRREAVKTEAAIVNLVIW